MKYFSMVAANLVMLLPMAAYANPADQDAFFDITVLSARVLPGVTIKDVDQVENCDKTRDTVVDYGYKSHVEQFDCTAYAGKRLGGTFFKPLRSWEFVDGVLRTPMDTPIVEVLTVVPADRLAQATQIGFSESFMGGLTNFFRANGGDGQTVEIGKVQLKDGRIGIVHRWLAAFDGNGSTGTGVIRTLPFKPVLVRNGQQYWDQLVGDGMFKDYMITNFDNRTYKSVAANSFDRSEQILK